MALTISLIFLNLMPTLFSSAQVGAAAPIFAPAYNLSSDSGTARAPNIQSLGSHVYVAWSEGSRGILFRESPDGGATWVPPISSSARRISNVGGTSQFPLISDNGSNVYVVWSQTVGTTGLQVFIATSTNYGATFSTAVQITSGIITNGHITPVIASWGANVYVSYLAGTSTYVVSSANAGVTWSSPFRVGLREPQLAVSANNVYAVSVGGAARSTNNGLTWSRITISGGCCGSEPWVWASGPNAYIARETKGNQSQVEVVHTSNYGATWTSHFLLSSTLSNSWAPMIWAVGNTAWIATQQNPGGSKSQIWIYTTNNAGSTWSSPFSLSGSGGRGTATSFPFTVSSSDGTNVFVGWSHQASSGYWVFRVAFSGDGGSTWTAAPSINVSGNPAGTQAGNNNDVANGAIAATGTHCYAVWLYVNGKTNQIYFASS